MTCLRYPIIDKIHGHMERTHTQHRTSHMPYQNPRNQACLYYSAGYSQMPHFKGHGREVHGDGAAMHNLLYILEMADDRIHPHQCVLLQAH